MFKLKSVNPNFTLAAHSPKFGQTKTHFLSHLGEKKREKILLHWSLVGKLAYLFSFHIL